jgi:hypothetical protein
MPASHRRCLLVIAVVIALTAVMSFQAFEPGFGAAQHLSFAILPCIGSLAVLPSDPGAWITREARAAITIEPLAPAVPPRAPPV